MWKFPKYKSLYSSLDLDKKHIEKYLSKILYNTPHYSQNEMSHSETIINKIEMFNKLSSKEQKEFLLFLGVPNLKVNLAKGYHFMNDQLHYFTKLDNKNSDSVYFDKFPHYNKLDGSIAYRIQNISLDR